MVQGPACPRGGLLGRRGSRWTRPALLRGRGGAEERTRGATAGGRSWTGRAVWLVRSTSTCTIPSRTTCAAWSSRCPTGENSPRVTGPTGLPCSLCCGVDAPPSVLTARDTLAVRLQTQAGIQLRGGRSWQPVARPRRRHRRGECVLPHSNAGNAGPEGAGNHATEWSGVAARCWTRTSSAVHFVRGRCRSRAAYQRL